MNRLLFTTQQKTELTHTYKSCVKARKGLHLQFEDKHSTRGAGALWAKTVPRDSKPQRTNISCDRAQNVPLCVVAQTVFEVILTKVETLLHFSEDSLSKVFSDTQVTR